MTAGRKHRALALLVLLLLLVLLVLLVLPFYGLHAGGVGFTGRAAFHQQLEDFAGACHK